MKFNIGKQWISKPLNNYLRISFQPNISYPLCLSNMNQPFHATLNSAIGTIVSFRQASMCLILSQSCGGETGIYEQREVGAAQ